MFAFFLTLLIIDSVVLATVILLQSGKGGGLAAMGGSASTESFFGGRQAVTILTKMSWWCGGIFLFLSLILAGMGTRAGAPRSALDDLGEPVPVAPTPAALPLDLQSGGTQPADSGGQK
ncbi:MAG: preprotein translocase subunit SecG [Gemmatimonadales bacterium]